MAGIGDAIIIKMASNLIGEAANKNYGYNEFVAKAAQKGLTGVPQIAAYSEILKEKEGKKKTDTRQKVVSEAVTAGMRPDTEQIEIEAQNRYIQHKSGLGLRTPKTGTAKIYQAVPGTTPVTQEAIATRTMAQWPSDKPAITMDELKRDPRFATAPEAITPAQRLAADTELGKAQMSAEQKAAEAKAKALKEERERAEKADAVKRKEVQANLARERENLTAAQKSFTAAEGKYTELQSAVDAVDKGESVPGEFYRDAKNNIRYKTVDEMREELTRREDALDLAKKSRNKAKSSIEKWQEQDTALSRRIEKEIEIEQQTAAEKKAKLKGISDAIKTIDADNLHGANTTPQTAAPYIEKRLKENGVDEVIIGRIVGQLKKGVTLTKILETINPLLSE